jgi:hypothetical protein
MLVGMRRVGLVLALLATALAPLGCAGADGERAQELLVRSNEALADVESYRFAGRLSMETPVGGFTFVMRGGGNAKDGGSSFMSMEAEGVPGFPGVTVVTRGGTAWMSAGAGWQRVELPAESPVGVEQLDFTPYVKDVEVEDGHEVAGEAAVKITGVLDTAALVNGVFAQLGAVPGGAVPDLSDAFEDTRIVLYLSEATHLPLRTLIDMAMEAEGERIDMHMDFAITGVNEPVKIPSVGG